MQDLRKKVVVGEMKNSEALGWLAVGSKGRVHYFDQIDSINERRRISVCGKKQHVFDLIEPTEQLVCKLCQKFLGASPDDALSISTEV